MPLVDLLPEVVSVLDELCEQVLGCLPGPLTLGLEVLQPPLVLLYYCKAFINLLLLFCQVVLN